MLITQAAGAASNGSGSLGQIVLKMFLPHDLGSTACTASTRPIQCALYSQRNVQWAAMSWQELEHVVELALELVGDDLEARETRGGGQLPRLLLLEAQGAKPKAARLRHP